MRLIVCSIAAIVYVWYEQIDNSFPPTQFTVFAFGIIVLSLILIRFRRGESQIQPSDSIANVLSFIGRHTLEIYAIQLAGSDLIVRILPYIAACSFERARQLDRMQFHHSD